MLNFTLFTPFTLFAHFITRYARSCDAELPASAESDFDRNLHSNRLYEIIVLVSHQSLRYLSTWEGSPNGYITDKSLLNDTTQFLDLERRSVSILVRILINLK
jgi:hypothetical protein